MATDSDDSSFPFPNKLRKTLSSTSKLKIQDNPNHCHFEAQEQLQWTANSNSNSPCMICLTDSAKTIRGIIDCCDHHFCFLCIMEWAKIESRCPICKRRFSTIHRPFKDRVFYRERVVKVPVRDQIYTPYGNTTAGPSDPFSQVLCSICHQMTDDSLLLLCDLCDSASHTYCVGLGFTVPEGDWFCHDCTVCRTQLVNKEMDADNDNEKVIPTPEEHVPIVNIVREPNSPAVARKATRSSNLNLLSPLVAPDRGNNNIVVEVNGPAATTLQNVADETTQPGARTLQRCRDVHSHIQAIRENWHAFRNGSLSFSSLSSKSSCRSGQKSNIRAVSQERSDQQNSSYSTSCQRLTTEASFPESSGDNRSSHDIDKAWKMLFKAKSIQHNLEKPSCTNQVSKLHSSTGKAAKDTPSISSTFHSLKNKQFGAKDVGRIAMKKNYDCYSLDKDIGNCQSGKVKKQKQSNVTTKETVDSSESEGVAVTHSLASFKSPFSRNKWSGVQGNVCGKNGSTPLEGYVNGALNITDKDNESTCSMSLVGSMPRVADSLYAKTEISTSVPGEVDFLNKRVRSGKDLSESNAVKDDEAKSEIRSLVKLNLKLLSRDKKLGVHAFKEVARLATHTILAACGLEHRMSGVHPFPSSVCSHTEHIQQLHKSTLMPNSCRECFCIFVKDVVNSVMFQKLSCIESN